MKVFGFGQLRKKDRTTKVFSLLLLGTFFLVAILSPLAMARMDHHHEGMAASGHCPFMVDKAALCEMGALEHIASWQMLFASFLTEEFLTTFILLLFIILLTRLRWLFNPESDLLQNTNSRYLLDESGTYSFTTLYLQSAISPRAP